MLRKVNNKTVDGEGFSVTLPSIHEIRYVEGARAASIEIEGGVDGHWYVYSTTLTGWLSPHNRTPLTEDDRKRILTNISKSLDTLGLDFEIE